MKPHYWFVLCLLFACQHKKTEHIAKLPDAPKEDTTLSYRKLLHIPSKEQEGSRYYEYFLEGKKLLQLSDSLAFTNDYEIRLYIFGRVANCFRYVLHNDRWEGEEILKIDTSVTPPIRHSVYPYYGWKVFIENAVKNGLLEMPTSNQMDEELKKLGKLYPNHALDVMDGHGQSVMIELISKDFYDLRMYDRRYDFAEEFPIKKYPEAVVLDRIHNLVSALTQIKVNDAQ